MRLRGPLAENPTARILHVLVLSLAICYALLSVILLPPYPQVGLRLAIAVLRELGPLAALVLLRRGLFRPAAVAYLAGSWLATTVSLTLTGGIHSPSQIYYVTLPILATWLLGYRSALWTAGACLGSALIFAILELAGVNLFRITSVTPFAIWVMLIQVVLLAPFPSRRF